MPCTLAPLSCSLSPLRRADSVLHRSSCILHKFHEALRTEDTTLRAGDLARGFLARDCGSTMTRKPLAPSYVLAFKVCSGLGRPIKCVCSRNCLQLKPVAGGQWQDEGMFCKFNRSFTSKGSSKLFHRPQIPSLRPRLWYTALCIPL